MTWTLWLLTACANVGLDEFGDPGAGLLQIAPAGDVDFGEVPVNGEGEATLRFISGGADGVLIEDITVEGAPEVFVPRGLTTPRVVQPGDEMPLVIRFLPTAARDYNAVLVVETPGLDALTINKRLMGEGCPDTNRDSLCDP
ncbi:MAG: hypothetical protein H6740_25860 [Alphaproteobacteria bacterium]|nr:hypothetical protein [Alphaproteobacteria bacterium]